MQEVRQSASIGLIIGPFVDATDGKTPETGVDVATADIATIYKHNVSASIALATSTFTHVAQGMYLLYASTSLFDTLGQATIVIEDSSVCLPVWKDLMVVGKPYYDMKYGTGGLTIASVSNSVRLYDTTIASVSNSVRLYDAALTIASVSNSVRLYDSTIASVSNSVRVYDNNLTIASVSNSVHIFDGTTIASVSGSVIVRQMTAAALADFFDTDSGTNYAAAVAGSVVKETADNAGGSALTNEGIASTVWETPNATIASVSNSVRLYDAAFTIASVSNSVRLFDSTIASVSNSVRLYDSALTIASVSNSVRLFDSTIASVSNSVRLYDTTIASVSNSVRLYDAALTIASVSNSVRLYDTTISSVSGSCYNILTTVYGQLPAGTLSDFDSAADQVIVATNNDKTDYALSAAGIDSMWDEVMEGAYTGRQYMRLFSSVLFGKSSGGGTANLTFRDTGDSKARVTASVTADGDRSTITVDAS